MTSTKIVRSATGSPGSTTSHIIMGHSFRTYLAGETLLTCRSCNNHLAVGESVLSKVSVVLYYDRSLCGNWGWRATGVTRSQDRKMGGIMGIAEGCGTSHWLLGLVIATTGIHLPAGPAASNWLSSSLAGCGGNHVVIRSFADVTSNLRGNTGKLSSYDMRQSSSFDMQHTCS